MISARSVRGPDLPPVFIGSNPGSGEEPPPAKNDANQNHHEPYGSGSGSSVGSQSGFASSCAASYTVRPLGENFKTH